MLTLKARRVVLPGGISPASLKIDGGRIIDVAGYDASVTDGSVVDVGDLTISPGVIDTHVHINEPGRTDWEGFDCATRAAAAGGVTTLVDMPLNSVPATTSVAALQAKLRAAQGRVHVNVGFWGGVVPGNAAELLPLIAAGVRGFKCFLTPSGVPEFQHVGEADLREALPVLSSSPHVVPLLVHAEDPAFIKSSSDEPHRYASYLATRPPSAEASAIRLVGTLSAQFGAAVHIVHVSSEDGVEAIAQARRGGAAMTAETCPHYLTFSGQEVPDGATEFKCAPPIREPRHREALWNALDRGVLQLIASDHSPSPPAAKRQDSGDFMAAWGGIASLQVALPAVWTQARSRGFTEHHVARWMSEAPARLAGLHRTKGVLAAGYDADFVVWDPDSTQVVNGHHLWHRHPITPYAGRTLNGLVHATYVGGRCVWREGHFERESAGSLL